MNIVHITKHGNFLERVECSNLKEYIEYEIKEHLKFFPNASITNEAKSILSSKSIADVKIPENALIVKSFETTYVGYDIKYKTENISTLNSLKEAVFSKGFVSFIYKLRDFYMRQNVLYEKIKELSSDYSRLDEYMDSCLKTCLENLTYEDEEFKYEESKNF